MSIISDEIMSALLKEARAYLGITWMDEDGDVMLKRYIVTSAKRLERIYGYDLNFDESNEENTAADSLAHELLIARVFYLREKALDDFDSNFRGELLTLRNYGKIKTLMERQTEDSDNA